MQLLRLQWVCGSRLPASTVSSAPCACITCWQLQGYLVKQTNKLFKPGGKLLKADDQRVAKSQYSFSIFRRNSFQFLTKEGPETWPCSQTSTPVSGTFQAAVPRFLTPGSVSIKVRNKPPITRAARERDDSGHRREVRIGISGNSKCEPRAGGAGISRHICRFPAATLAGTHALVGCI